MSFKNISKQFKNLRLWYYFVKWLAIIIDSAHPIYSIEIGLIIIKLETKYILSFEFKKFFE